MNYIDLFSGIGGFALGAYWAGMRFENHYFSEVDPYCVELYHKRFPDAIPLGDITKHEQWNLAEGEYIISGGFPCQPFSTASRGRKTAVDLWPAMYAAITTIKPVWTVAENVSLEAIAQARADIGGQIYEISSADVGATHNRVRYWLLSDSDMRGQPVFKIDAQMASICTLPRLDMWQREPENMGMDDGISRKMDRLKGLGNAIVPQIAQMLFEQVALHI